MSHAPQQDEEGFRWRTIIELYSAPQLPAELLQQTVDRRAGWTTRERRRDACGRRGNLTAILRRAGSLEPRDAPAASPAGAAAHPVRAAAVAA